MKILEEVSSCIGVLIFLTYAYTSTTSLRADMNIGNQVGKGAFAEVLIVLGVKDDSRKRLEALSPSPHGSEKRILSNVTANSSNSLLEDDDSSNLVIKRVRDDLDEEEKISSTVDLLIESEFLAHLSHPHIVKLIW